MLKLNYNPPIMYALAAAAGYGYLKRPSAPAKAMVLVGIQNDGTVTHAALIVRSSLTSITLDENELPIWLRDRIALLRLCETKPDQDNELFGRKLSDNLMYIYINSDEATELRKGVRSP